MASSIVRVAVIDMGTNSTRLLVADVDGSVSEVVRRTTVTGLGRGVDTSHQLSTEAMDAVCDAVGSFMDDYRARDPDRVIAVATSALRDAENSDVFLAELRERFALDTRVIDGAEEARLTYLGACADRDACDGTLVVDIGGGSTELIVGSRAGVDHFTSLQAGVVRQTERHLVDDPPAAAQLEELAEDVRGLIDSKVAPGAISEANEGIAVAGTPTSLAAIEQGLDPYDPEKVHGYVLSRDAIQHLCSQLSATPLAERREVKGLHPDRAPTIVAGTVILIQVMRAFGLDEIEVSEHDLLWGAALDAAAG
jgi:exopolyphosphatase/guanosine-5'-triphosphate,3'-diphosphate pyrophosphatase